MSTAARPKSANEVVETWTSFHRALLNNYEFMVRDWLKEANLTAPTVADFVSHYHGVILDRTAHAIVSDLIRAVHFELTATDPTLAQK
jgi:hypothetical protein